jgi:hypothetical protein
MICFDLVRVKITSLGLAALVAGSMLVAAPQASFASDWMDLLKPLVTNVIVPGASLGMKKFIQHEEKMHPELAGKVGGSSSSASTTSNSSSESSGNGMDQFFDNSSATSSDSATTASFASPEEPISSNSEGSAGSAYWAASHSVSATDPAPAPPPPVATP